MSLKNWRIKQKNTLQRWGNLSSLEDWMNWFTQKIHLYLKSQSLRQCHQIINHGSYRRSTHNYHPFHDVQIQDRQSDLIYMRCVNSRIASMVLRCTTNQGPDWKVGFHGFREPKMHQSKATYALISKVDLILKDTQTGDFSRRFLCPNKQLRHGKMLHTIWAKLMRVNSG